MDNKQQNFSGMTVVIALIAIVLLLLPIIINVFCTIPAKYSVLEGPSNWTIFWGSYLGGVASFLMVFIAWKTLIAQKEEIRPYLSFCIEHDNASGWLYLRIKNVGKSIARDLSLSLKEQSLPDHPSAVILNQLKNNLKNVSGSCLEPSETIRVKLFYKDITPLWVSFWNLESGIKEKGQEEKLIGFDTPISLSESNANFEYFAKNLLRISAQYSKLRPQTAVLDVTNFKIEPHDNLWLIATSLKNIEDILKQGNVTKKKPGENA